jgi:hypothetical protein
LSIRRPWLQWPYSARQARGNHATQAWPDGSLGIRATGTKQQSTSGDGIAIHTQINIASDGTAKAESSSSGRAAESGKQIADMVNGLISKAMADQMRQGGLLWKMKNGQN